MIWQNRVAILPYIYYTRIVYEKENRVVIPKKANLSSTWKNETLNGDYTYNGLTKDGDPHFKDSYQ